MSNEIEPVSREVVERVAKIMGVESAAHRAVEELDERLAKGEEVVIYQAGATWIVGPAPPVRETV